MKKKQQQQQQHTSEQHNTLVLICTLFRIISLFSIRTTALKTLSSSNCKLTRFSRALHFSPLAVIVKFTKPDWPTKMEDLCVAKYN